MVFVSVREDDRPHLVPVFEKIRHIGNHDIDAQEFLFGEEYAAVDDDDGVLRAERHHVHSEFTESAERHDFKRVGHGAQLYRV